MADPDDLTAALAKIGERAKAAAELNVDLIAQFIGPDTKSIAGWIAASALDVPLLLAAIEAVLELHEQETEKIYHPCAEHVITRTAHDRERFAKMDNCPDCTVTPHQVCAHCDCAKDEWPCPTVRAITEALAKEETP